MLGKSAHDSRESAEWKSQKRREGALARAVPRRPAPARPVNRDITWDNRGEVSTATRDSKAPLLVVGAFWRNDTGSSRVPSARGRRPAAPARDRARAEFSHSSLCHSLVWTIFFAVSAAGYGGIWRDTGRYREIPRDTRRYLIPGDTRYGQIRADTGERADARDARRYTVRYWRDTSRSRTRASVSPYSTLRASSPHALLTSVLTVRALRESSGRCEPCSWSHTPRAHSCGALSAGAIFARRSVWPEFGFSFSPPPSMAASVKVSSPLRG